MPITFNVQHFDSLDSTNKEVLRQAEAGAKEGLVVVANKQTAGKGRLGRSWSTIDDALAMSLLLRPDIKPTKIPQLSLMTAVAVHEALSLFTPHIGIKWPNDLLIFDAKGNAKKVCGILTEMRCKGANTQAVVLGIGINIFEPTQGWAEPLTPIATSLNHQSNGIAQKNDVLQAVLESLATWYACLLTQGFSPILKAWEAAHIATGQSVSVHDGNNYIQGIAQGLAADGTLRLLVNGVEQRIIAGDVSLMENNR